MRAARGGGGGQTASWATRRAEQAPCAPAGHRRRGGGVGGPGAAPGAARVHERPTVFAVHARVCWGSKRADGPAHRIATFSSLASMAPDPSVSNRSNASLRAPRAGGPRAPRRRPTKVLTSSPRARPATAARRWRRPAWRGRLRDSHADPRTRDRLRGFARAFPPHFAWRLPPLAGPCATRRADRGRGRRAVPEASRGSRDRPAAATSRRGSPRARAGNFPFNLHGRVRGGGNETRGRPGRLVSRLISCFCSSVRPPAARPPAARARRMDAIELS